MRTPAGLRELSRTVDGIGPWVNQLYRKGRGNKGIRETGLVAEAHALGLVVHPYTFRSDALADGFETFDEMVAYFVGELLVDGLFTDFPGEVAAILRRTLA